MLDKGEFDIIGSRYVVNATAAAVPPKPASMSLPFAKSGG